MGVHFGLTHHHKHTGNAPTEGHFANIDLSGRPSGQPARGTACYRSHAGPGGAGALLGVIRRLWSRAPGAGRGLDPISPLSDSPGDPESVSGGDALAGGPPRQLEGGQAENYRLGGGWSCDDDTNGTGGLEQLDWTPFTILSPTGPARHS